MNLRPVTYEDTEIPLLYPAILKERFAYHSGSFRPNKLRSRGNLSKPTLSISALVALRYHLETYKVKVRIILFLLMQLG